MIVEFVGSIALGLLAGSLALLAFGGDSLIELISGLAVLFHLRNDANGSEAHGSGGIGRLATALLFFLIPVIGVGAVYSFVSGLRPEGSPLGMVLAVGAVVVMPYLYFQKKKIGEQTRELSLQIDAIESVTCFLMSAALLGGLLIEFFFGLWWVDYVATGIILAFVAREAAESYHELHDTFPGQVANRLQAKELALSAKGRLDGAISSKQLNQHDAGLRNSRP